MGVYLFRTLFLFLQYYATNSQPQEQFYFFDFNGLQDWTIENVGSNLIVDSTSSNCPNPPCWQMEGQSIANLTISTIGYHTLHIIIDVTETGLHNGEYCYFSYKSPSSTTWQNTRIIGKNDDINLNVLIILPDNIDYNNQQSLYLRISNAGNSNVDKCFYDNLEIWGIPYTTNPSANPTHIPTISPTNPTIFPTQSPIHNPTKSPTNNPTKIPTINPTNIPTNIPTISPTPSPTNNPSLNPSITPTYNPSKIPTNNPTYKPTNIPTISPTPSPTYNPTYPTNNPTNNPSIYPTKYPTNDPTIDPTIDPTYDPTIDPTFDPTIYPTIDPSNDPTINPTPSPILIIRKVPSMTPTFKPTLLPIYLDIITSNSVENMESKYNNTENNIGTFEIIIGISGIALCIICIGIVIYKHKHKHKYKTKTNEKMTAMSVNDLQQNNVTLTPNIQMTSTDLHIERFNDDSDDEGDIINAAHITLGGFDLMSDMNKNEKQNKYNEMNNSDEIDDIENINENNNQHNEGINESDEDVLPMVNNVHITPGGITPGGNELSNENENINMITAGGMDIDMNEDFDDSNDKMEPKITIGSDQMITIGGDFDVDVIDTNSSNDNENVYEDYNETIQ